MTYKETDRIWPYPLNPSREALKVLAEIIKADPKSPKVAILEKKVWGDK